MPGGRNILRAFCFCAVCLERKYKMEIEKLISIINSCADCTDEGAKPRDYSGRGMYGKKNCLGVVVDMDYNGGYLSFVANLSLDVVLNLMEEFDDEGELLEAEEIWDAIHEVKKMLSNIKVDNMGRDYIVYFPDIPFIKS